MFRDFRFEAAHQLTCVPSDHRCAKLHGHTWVARLTFAGQVGKEGWIFDWGVLDKVIGPLREEIDHVLLNGVSGLENPTSENVARWIWDRFVEHVSPDIADMLFSVEVRENDDVGVIYEGMS